MCDDQIACFCDDFLILQGEAGFEQLRKATKKTSDVFREITNVLAERLDPTQRVCKKA